MLRSWGVSAASSSSSSRWRSRSSTRRGHGRVEQRLAAADPADAIDEVGAPDLLEQVAGCAGEDGGVDGLVVGERGQHHAGDLGAAGADLAAHLDPAAVGQAHVEDGDVRVGHGDAVVGFLGAARLADDLEVVLGVDELTKPATDDLVVVEQEHTGGHGRHCVRSRAIPPR